MNVKLVRRLLSVTLAMLVLAAVPKSAWTQERGSGQFQGYPDGECPLSSYVLIKVPALSVAEIDQPLGQIATLGTFDEVRVGLVCQSAVQSLVSAVPAAVIARQTRSLIAPHFDPATQQWQQARYIWYEETQNNYLLEHLTVLDFQTGSVLSTKVILVGASKHKGLLATAQVDLIAQQATSDQVVLPQDTLQVLLQRWPYAGVTSRIALEFRTGKPLWHVQRSEQEGTVSYFVDGSTGEPLGRYPIPTEEGLDPSQGIPFIPEIAPPTDPPDARLSSTVDPLGSMFVVGVDDTASWRDLGALATVPVAARVNNGKPVILLRSLQSGQDPSVDQFSALYNPSQTYYVGTLDPGAITGANEIQIAANLAAFWTQSPTVALAVHTDYANALLAAQLAARLDVPLLFVTSSGVPTATQGRLAALGTASAVVLGSPGTEVLAQLQALGIDATVLGDAEQVAAYTAGLGTVDYVVVTNPLDRTYDGWVPRLSLLAPALAAYHRGIIYPASFEVEWKTTHPATATTTTRPPGAWQGSDDRICYEFGSATPPRASGATWQLYTIQGNYANGTMDWLAGDYWERRTFYLAASTPGAASFDRVLIDVNADGVVADNEVLRVGDTFVVNDRLYRVYQLDGDGDWGGRTDHMVLHFETWKLGTAEVGEQGYPFAVTCGRATEFGAYDVANIDLNRDGDFEDEGEGPFWPGDDVVLNAKQYAVTPGHDGSLRLTYPNARQISSRMWQQLDDLGLDPIYVAILGYYDAVPFGVYREIMISDEDVSSDMAYGEHDADPFLDASVGRLFGSDVFKASSLIARSVAYADLTGNWRERALTLSNGSLDFPGAETTAKNVERQLDNAGVAVTGLYESDYASMWDLGLMTDRAFLAHFDHGTPMSPWEMRTVAIKPTVGTFWGCSSAWSEGDPAFTNPAAFLDQGGAGYMGNTRLGAAPVSEHAFSLFWNRVINDGLTFGQAHRASVNFKVFDWLDSGQFGDLSLGYRLVYYGDPATSAALPHAPVGTPAHHTATGTGPEETVTYQGPGVWWTDTAHDDSGSTYYAVTGPGIQPTGWFGTRYLFEQPVSEQVRRVGQITEVSWPLGWTGRSFLDEGTVRQAVWMATPLDADSSDGQIRDRADLLDYLLLPAPLLSEVGQQANVMGTGRSHGVAWGDYDGDGYLDLYVTSYGATDVLYHNNRDGTFIDSTTAAGLAGLGSGRAAVWGDYDNDGDIDLYITRENGSFAELWRNNGNGTFSDVTTAAGLERSGIGMSAAWGDYDRDGFLDILVTRWCGTPLLYHSTGDGRFVDRSSAAGITARGCGVGALFADYDNDRNLDIYLTFAGADNVLYRNNGNGTFADATASAGVAGNAESQGPAWGDWDNDGDLDIYVASGSSEPDLLYRNSGTGAFTEVADAAGVTNSVADWGVAWGDYDNDGWLDLSVLGAEGLTLYHNNGDGTFSRANASIEPDHRVGGNGLAWGDYDNDGDLDLYIASQGSTNYLYRNDGGGNWLSIETRGIQSNRSGIGARVHVTSGGRLQAREISGASGIYSQNSLPAEFGLGASTYVDRIEIQWPSGIVQVLPGVHANQSISVTEGHPGDEHLLYLPLLLHNH